MLSVRRAGIVATRFVNAGRQGSDHGDGIQYVSAGPSRVGRPGDRGPLPWR
jgi:hypothetical protein